MHVAAKQRQNTAHNRHQYRAKKAARHVPGGLFRIAQTANMNRWVYPANVMIS